jgi:protocatechuate 3,4-dioxygenase beta subunit
MWMAAAMALFGCGCSGAQESDIGSSDLPDCEWCGATEAPPGIGPSASLAGPDEPGEPLLVTGTVYRPDAVTPASGVVIYAYQTDAEGRYSTRGDETGNGRRHGALRGWVRTNASGSYEFRTIRPAPYPSRSEPAHIHMTVLPPGGEEYWIDSVMFADDPLLTDRIRARLESRGGTGVVDLERDAGGVLNAHRDIILMAGLGR